MNKKRNFFAILCLFTLLLTVSGCNFVGFNPHLRTQTPDIPETSPLQSPASPTASGSTITLRFTETQLNTLAQQELSGYQEVENLQISLREGTIMVSGVLRQSGMSLPAKIKLKVKVDGQGRPQTEILSGKAGPFPLPQSLLDEIATELNQVIRDELAAAENNLFVDSILIENGVLLISAHVATS